MKRILVTGGSGFVGKCLVNRLISKGYSVVSLGRGNVKHPNKKVKSISLDLESYNPVQKKLSKNFDVIVHLASVVNVNDMIKKPKETIISNVNSTFNLLEDIRLNNKNCLFVFASSDRVYGNTTSKQITEDHKTIPVEPYGSSKLISESLINVYSLNYDVKSVVLRSGNTFGPGQSPGLFIPSVISKMVGGQKVLKVGNLSAYRNFVYVEDVVDAYVKAIESKNAIGKIFNIASYNVKIGQVLKEIVKLASGFYGTPIKIISDKSLFRKSETVFKKSVLNCRKAHSILKWKPKYSFKNALLKTFESYAKHDKI